MLWCKLKRILAQKKLNTNNLYKMSGVSRPTITALMENRGKGIEYKTFNTLCKTLNITPNELFGYIPMDIKVSISNSVFDNADEDEKQITMSGDILFSLYKRDTVKFDFFVKGLYMKENDFYSCVFKMSDCNLKDYISFMIENHMPLELYSIIADMVHDKVEKTISKHDKGNYVGMIDLDEIQIPEEYEELL